MDPRRTRTLLATGLSALLVATSVLVVSAAPSGQKCSARKRSCPVTTSTTAPSTTSTTTSTTTTAPEADTTPPTMRIVSPTEGSAVSSGLGVTGSSADDRQVARVELRVDGGAWTPATGTTSWSMAVDTDTWAPGSTHTIGARAVDAAGNASGVAGVSVQKSADAPAPATGDPSDAPATQGTWTSPEGAVIDVASAGSWTIRDVYRMLLESSAAPGDFATIAPTLTVRVQDTTASQTTTSARSSDGIFTRFSSTLYLKGVSSTFAARPDEVLAHEYGHVWTMYHLYMTRQGDWSSYLGHRWANADGSVRLADDARLDSSYGWDRRELIGDDYRLLFGSAAAVSQRPTHMNTTIPEPSEVPGLRALFLEAWAG